MINSRLSQASTIPIPNAWSFPPGRHPVYALASRCGRERRSYVGGNRKDERSRKSVIYYTVLLTARIGFRILYSSSSESFICAQVLRIENVSTQRTLKGRLIRVFGFMVSSTASRTGLPYCQDNIEIVATTARTIVHRLTLKTPLLNFHPESKHRILFRRNRKG